MLDPVPACTGQRNTLYRLPVHCMASSWHGRPIWIQCGFSKPTVSRLEFHEGNCWWDDSSVYLNHKETVPPICWTINLFTYNNLLTFQSLTSSTVNMVSHLSGKSTVGRPPLPSSPLGILSSSPMKPIIPDSAAQQGKERERVPSFPSGEWTNLSLARVIQPCIEIGKCYCPNKFIQAAQKRVASFKITARSSAAASGRQLNSFWRAASGWLPVDGGWSQTAKRHLTASSSSTVSSKLL